MAVVQVRTTGRPQIRWEYQVKDDIKNMAKIAGDMYIVNKATNGVLKKTRMTSR